MKGREIEMMLWVIKVYRDRRNQMPMQQLTGYSGTEVKGRDCGGKVTIIGQEDEGDNSLLYRFTIISTKKGKIQ